MVRSIASIIFGVLLSLQLYASPVYLFGGGDRPNGAMKDFVSQSGGRILIVTWATSYKAETYENLKEQILDVAQSPDKITILHATEPHDTDSAAKFQVELSNATAVFLSGGDQNRALDIVEKYQLFEAFHEGLSRKVVYAGTSAGTAMLSEFAMTGEADLHVLSKNNTIMRHGLGIVKFLVDQHFLKRQRQNRLMSALLDYPDLSGVGVDEDNAVRYEDGKIFAYGPSMASVYRYDSAKSQFCIDIILDSESRILE